jgi:hypothetical protein
MGHEAKPINDLAKSGAQSEFVPESGAPYNYHGGGVREKAAAVIDPVSELALARKSALAGPHLSTEPANEFDRSKQRWQRQQARNTRRQLSTQ